MEENERHILINWMFIRTENPTEFYSFFILTQKDLKYRTQ